MWFAQLFFVKEKNQWCEITTRKNGFVVLPQEFQDSSQGNLISLQGQSSKNSGSQIAHLLTAYSLYCGKNLILLVYISYVFWLSNLFKKH